jgi:hypothetical protein
VSDQRKRRTELRQGFLQFSMQMYESYRESHTDEEAKSLVAESIKEQLGLFMGSDSFSGDLKEVIDKKLEELTNNRFGTNDYDQQMFLSEKIDTLLKAKEILGV